MTVSPVRLAVTTFCVCLLTLASVQDVRAQGFISPLIGFDFGGNSGCLEITGCEDKKLNVGVAFGAMGSVLAFEQEIAYARDFFGAGPGLSSNVLTIMSNLMVVPRIGPVRPYAVGGIGLIKSQTELTTTGLLETNNNNLGWDLGGGLMVFFGDHVGVRGEIRYFHTFQDLEILGVSVSDEKLDFGRAAAGLVLKF